MWTPPLDTTELSKKVLELKDANSQSIYIYILVLCSRTIYSILLENCTWSFTSWFVDFEVKNQNIFQEHPNLEKCTAENFGALFDFNGPFLVRWNKFHRTLIANTRTWQWVNWQRSHTIELTIELITLTQQVQAITANRALRLYN